MSATKCALWRRHLGTFVEFDRYDRLSRKYTLVITILTGVSLPPLCFKEPPSWTSFLEVPIACVFLFDYIARWMTADIRDTKYTGLKAFLMYPFEFWSIIDLLSLISFLPVIPTALRMMRLLRVVRLILVLELLRYSRGFYIMFEALSREKRSLLAVVAFMLIYIAAVALVMFSVEPDLFNTVLDAMYWSATSLATIGYGDFAPRTDIGRFIMFLSSIVGIAVVALPTGIITSAYVNTLNELRGRYATSEQHESIIDKLAQQKADELGVDVSEITVDDLFGHEARATARRYGDIRREERRASYADPRSIEDVMTDTIPGDMVDDESVYTLEDVGAQEPARPYIDSEMEDRGEE